MSLPTDDAPEEISLGRIYEEYVRISEVCNDYIHRSLGDIRLFGSIGALLAWDPLARLFELDAQLQQPVTPVGFLILLLLIVLVMFFDLLKQSIFFFHLQRMQALERVLNRAAGDRGELFHLAGGWPDWFRRYHAPAANGFWGVFYLLVVVFPSIILYLQEYGGWLFVYLPTAIVLLGLHACCAMRILGSLEP